MKMILIVALAFVAVAVAAPPSPSIPADVPQIVRSEFVQSPEGNYNFGYETDHGIVRSEIGEVKEAFDDENKPHVILTVRGFYSYTDNEGKPEKVDYYADETGYHPSGPSVQSAGPVKS